MMESTLFEFRLDAGRGQCGRGRNVASSSGMFEPCGDAHRNSNVAATPAFFPSCTFPFTSRHKVVGYYSTAFDAQVFHPTRLPVSACRRPRCS
jgi:hypothetical protein